MKFQARKTRRDLVAKAILAGCPMKEAIYRGSGRSLGYAMRIIGTALNNPDQPVVIDDHYTGTKNKAHMVQLLCDVIEGLGLNGLSVHQKNETVTYSLDW